VVRRLTFKKWIKLDVKCVTVSKKGSVKPQHLRQLIYRRETEYAVSSVQWAYLYIVFTCMSASIFVQRTIRFFAWFWHFVSSGIYKLLKKTVIIRLL